MIKKKKQMIKRLTGKRVCPSTLEELKKWQRAELEVDLKRPATTGPQLIIPKEFQ